MEGRYEHCGGNRSDGEQDVDGREVAILEEGACTIEQRGSEACEVALSLTAGSCAEQERGAVGAGAAALGAARDWEREPSANAAATRVAAGTGRGSGDVPLVVLATWIDSVEERAAAVRGDEWQRAREGRGKGEAEAEAEAAKSCCF